MASTSHEVDHATLESITRNRGRLLRLAENIKVRKKPGTKRSVKVKLDPGYTNIEHLVFGSYKPRSSTPSSSKALVADASEDHAPSRCECNAHSPRKIGTSDHGLHGPCDARVEAEPTHGWSTGASTLPVSGVVEHNGSPSVTSCDVMKAPRASLRRVQRSTSVQEKPKKTQDMNDPPVNGKQNDIIKVDLQTASRPKRDRTVVYAVEPTGLGERHIKVVPSGVSHAVVVPGKERVKNGERESAAANSSLVTGSSSACTKKPGVTAVPKVGTAAGSSRKVQLSTAFRKSASVSEKMPVKPISIPVVRNAAVHKWATGPRPPHGSFMEKRKPGSGVSTGAPQAHVPKSKESCKLVSFSAASVAFPNGTVKVSSRGGPGRYSLRQLPMHQPPLRPLVPTSCAKGPQETQVQPTCLKPNPVAAPPFVGAPLHASSRSDAVRCRSKVTTIELPFCPSSPLQAVRKGERTAEFIPVSPWKQVDHQPESGDRETFLHSPEQLLDDCISPPGMFKDRNIEDAAVQDNPPDLTSCEVDPRVLSRWVGNTSRESAKLLNQLASYAESKLSSRAGEAVQNKMVDVMADTWLNSLRKEACEEPVLMSPAQKKVSERPDTPRHRAQSHSASVTVHLPLHGHQMNGRPLTVRSVSADGTNGHPECNRGTEVHREASHDAAVLHMAPKPEATPTSSSPYHRIAPTYEYGCPIPPQQAKSSGRSPHKNACLVVTCNSGQIPPSVWMSDIEERDENSSSSTSRAASEEPQELGSSSRLQQHKSYVSHVYINGTQDTSSMPLSPPVERQESRSYNGSPADSPMSSPTRDPGRGGFVKRRSLSVCNGTLYAAQQRLQEDLSSGPEGQGQGCDAFDDQPTMGVYQKDSHNGSAAVLANAPSLARQLSDETEFRKPSTTALLHSPPVSKVLLGRPGKLVRNRPISRSERHLKAASSPEFHSGSTEDVSRNSRRPWSHLYSEAEAEQLLSSVGSMPSIQKDVASSDNQSSIDVSVLNPRYSSLRASSSRLTADGVLQKFKKTFSLRFQRSRKGSTTSLPSAEETEGKDELLDSGEQWKNGSPTSGSPLASPKKGTSGGVPRSDEEDPSGGFKLGPIILRSSRERKLHRKNKELRGSKCSSADSGIQLEGSGVYGEHRSEVPVLPSEILPNVEQKSRDPAAEAAVDGGCSNLRGSYSSLSQSGTVTENSDVDSDQKRSSLDSDRLTPLHQTMHKAPSAERFSTPPAIKSRTDRHRPTIRRQKGRGRLRRSISQPLDLEKAGSTQRGELTRGLSDQEASRDPSSASSEEDFSSDGEFYCQGQIAKNYDGVAYVEALWDHVTMDSEELAFQVGEVIEVTDMSDKDWWWGSIDQRSGWFPAEFVRLRVNQEDTVEDCMCKMADGTLTKHKPRKMSISLLSNEQVRANVVMEIVNTEQDFVRHLRDVVEGYLKPVCSRPDMFSEERRATIFGNLEQLYEFQSRFLACLESSINWEQPHLSEIGSVFVEHKAEFQIYSEYCNNHPLAVSELQEMYADSRYVHFFEACRLLQDMIDISLDGFLLTPVQKICKYPLQLAELLKYTRPDHPDYQPVSDALEAMRGVAQMVNERKRRMECLEKLAEWQRDVFNWEGPDLLETSSVLIYSGEAVRVTSSWSRDVVSLFLFDHLLVYCKKDMIKRNTLSYKGRLNMDTCRIADVEDGKDMQFGVTVKNAWKVYCSAREKCYLFYAKTAVEKQQWLKAFRNEQERVHEDKEQGYVVTENAKKTARMALNNKLKPKRPRAKLPKGPRTQHPDVAVVEILLDPPGPKPRTGSLPSNLHPVHNVPSNGLPKKKGSGWFHFGSGKKVKK
ncbi:uncharacterized protein LOC135366883 isoform X2 [Ornithodoros turicata]|uniref:uncharacterized protein LOC135366883 isoform X2 n=1 Tax=Ornithodoros turicata TaxID=34597 RepID=UPI003139C4CE